MWLQGNFFVKGLGIPCLFKGLLISSNAAVYGGNSAASLQPEPKFYVPLLQAPEVILGLLLHIATSASFQTSPTGNVDSSTLTHLPMSFSYVYLDYRHRGEEIHQFAHGFIIADDCIIFYLHNSSDWFVATCIRF